MHILYGGPERWMSVNGRTYVFEDHPYCGPVVLTGKHKRPSERQPDENSWFWQHVNAWYSQGKKVRQVGDKVWCVYETQMQQARRAHKKARVSTT